MGGMVSRPDIRGSAGAGFGTGLYTAPFRPRPGIRRYKARPSHAQCFLRLHPGSLAPMRQRPGLRFPIPHLESFPPHIRAALACPLSVDRDGFLSLSLSLTEGNAPPFGPIRGRQRLEIPRSIAPAQGFLCRGIRFPPRCRPDRRQGPGGPFPRIFQGVPQTRGKSHAERWIRSRSVPPGRRQRFRTVNNNSIRRAYPSEARQRFRTISKDGIRLGVPHGKAAKATAFCRHFPRLAGVPRQAAEARSCRTGHAAQRIPLRCAAKAAISAGHPPVIPPRHAAQVAHVLT